MEHSPEALSDWYRSLYSRRVDIVGDYAGSEPFCIELDSLLLLCFSDPKIDFDYGFQLLHAAHKVEKLLKDLAERDCNFHIVYFDQNAELCIPSAAQPENRSKYLLARAVIIRHLYQNLPHDLQSCFHHFFSITEEAFLNFLNEKGIYFVMCHDGASSDVLATNTKVAEAKENADIRPERGQEASSNLRAMISWFISNRHNVALINELQFVDTKVFTVVLEHTRSKRAFKLVHSEDTTVPQLTLTTIPHHLDHLSQLDDLSEADVISILAVQGLLEGNHISKLEAEFLLLHTAALRSLNLANRRFPKVSDTQDAQRLMTSFAESVRLLLQDLKFLRELGEKHLACDVIDLVDGFLLSIAIHDSRICSQLLANSRVQSKYQRLRKHVSQLCDSPIGLDLGEPETTTCTKDLPSPSDMSCDALPFTNPVFGEHLKPIRLQVDNTPLKFAAGGQSKVFKELSHWHNHRKSIVQKGPPPTQSFYALRRNQWFMAEMQAYAASLTNAAGKLLEPETVVAGESGPSLRQSKTSAPTKANVSKPKQHGNSKKTGGKAAALAAAAAIQSKKAQSKADVNATFWKGKCNEILSQSNPMDCYSSAKAYLGTLGETDVIRPEVELFLVDCLLRLWTESRKSTNSEPAMGAAALAWNSCMRVSQSQVGLTPEVATTLAEISKLMGFPQITFSPNSPSRPLGFTVLFLKNAKKQMHDLSIPGGPVNFQLEHCGPYLDRAHDSAPDPRVPFQPDAWQRKVLDAIDKDQSLFVVAPTSAGKTFISFYAMKKALQNSDEDVLVYIAPTKALVNQIAAEIQSRFSKTYKHSGRSVWGIHTRDYRINNPTGCQILVTVPHILQIMLLVPSNAEKKNSWSCRVKRIIFDEIHCIGQAEDGVIWEQLLLQAPCPIIALSATVGNPGEFSAWLGSTQEANGHELVTVQHQHRYSDLRKFIYVPPQDFCFSGVPCHTSVHIPGLDGVEAFNFVHPVVSLMDRSRGLPDDLTLEPRDCLRLWDCMAKFQTKDYPLPHNLEPDRIIHGVIRKADALQWEAQVKTVLLKWMGDKDSPFGKVQEELSKALNMGTTRPRLATQHDKCDHKCVSRQVDDDDLASTILPALVDLHAQGALPAIVFNYERVMCEKLAKTVIQELEAKEDVWKQNDPGWTQTIAAYTEWKRHQETGKTNEVKKPAKKGKRGDDEKLSKLDRERGDLQVEVSKWAHFNPDKPVDGFHFTDIKKLSGLELKEYQTQLRRRGIAEWLIKALERGVGVHHAGMNRKYRHVVEILFRKGFLRVVIATGTLALGINMPCKTVVFAGDSVFLTALNYRQGAGRAGRRGFDVLGNVVFLGVPQEKVFRLMSSRLPDLRGHFPITTSLVLRLATLLHESNNSLFAIQTINSILTQPRLYLGSAELKAAVLHHLRFSIEYLRRNGLLDANGDTLNFAGCVSHLYYAENAAWAFHALLSAGYFHDLCRDIDTDPDQTCLTLMLVCAHIFGRHLCKRSDKEFIEEIVKRSSSIVFLPRLPNEAEKCLRDHNAQTLAIFRSYVKTFADQHLHEPDEKLPLTNLRIGSNESLENPLSASLPQTTIRSPFVALSGHGDEFDSISDLCNTVRSGVFLEEAVIPYLPIFPDEADTPLNAYLYDFYKHGDVKALEHANKIRASDVWFLLNDFSLVLATIVTSLTNFMSLNPHSDADMIDLMGGGDLVQTQLDDKAILVEQGSQAKVPPLARESKPSLSVATAEAWDDEEDSSSSDQGASGDGSDAKFDAADGDPGSGLRNVLKAFELLQMDFNEKFKKIWA